MTDATIVVGRTLAVEQSDTCVFEMSGESHHLYTVQQIVDSAMSVETTVRETEVSLSKVMGGKGEIALIKGVDQMRVHDGGIFAVGFLFARYITDRYAVVAVYAKEWDEFIVVSSDETTCFRVGDSIAGSDTDAGDPWKRAREMLESYCE